MVPVKALLSIRSGYYAGRDFVVPHTEERESDLALITEDNSECSTRKGETLLHDLWLRNRRSNIINSKLFRILKKDDI